MSKKTEAGPVVPIDTLHVYKTLCDLVDEASAVDTVIGRPQTLYEKLTALRDYFGSMKVSPYVAHPPAQEQPAPGLTQAAQMALEALELAQAGLLWYQDMCPQHTDGSDDEANAQIEKAITSLRGHLSKQPKKLTFEEWYVRRLKDFDGQHPSAVAVWQAAQENK